MNRINTVFSSGCSINNIAVATVSKFKLLAMLLARLANYTIITSSKEVMLSPVNICESDCVGFNIPLRHIIGHFGDASFQAQLQLKTNYTDLVRILRPPARKPRRLYSYSPRVSECVWFNVPLDT